MIFLLVIQELNIYIHRSLFNIFKHAFWLKHTKKKTKLCYGSCCGRSIMNALVKYNWGLLYHIMVEINLEDHTIWWNITMYPFLDQEWFQLYNHIKKKLQFGYFANMIKQSRSSVETLLQWFKIILKQY